MPFPTFTNPFAKQGSSALTRKKSSSNQEPSHLSSKFNLGLSVFPNPAPDCLDRPHPATNAPLSSSHSRAHSNVAVTAAIVYSSPVGDALPYSHPTGYHRSYAATPDVFASARAKHRRPPPLRLASVKHSNGAHSSRSRSASAAAAVFESIRHASQRTAASDGCHLQPSPRPRAVAGRPAMLRRASSLDSGGFLPHPPVCRKHSVSSSGLSPSECSGGTSPGPSTAHTTPLSSARVPRLPVSPRTSARPLRAHAGGALLDTSFDADTPAGWMLEFVHNHGCACCPFPDVPGPLATVRQSADAPHSALEPTLHRRVRIGLDGRECVEWELRLSLPPRRFGSTPGGILSSTARPPPLRMRARLRSKTLGLRPVGTALGGGARPGGGIGPLTFPAHLAATRKPSQLANLVEQDSVEELVSPRSGRSDAQLSTQAKLRPDRLPIVAVQSESGSDESMCEKRPEWTVERQVAHNKLVGASAHTQMANGYPFPDVSQAYSFGARPGDGSESADEEDIYKLESKISFMKNCTQGQAVIKAGNKEVGDGNLMENSYWSETDMSASNLAEDEEVQDDDALDFGGQ